MARRAELGAMKKTLLAALLSGAAWALPENGQVIQGQLQMAQPNANVLQILQSSPTGIINWGSFNIGAQQLVQFLQPNSAAATLNRVIGQEPSQILGQLQANGRILLVNPNGILFGPGSVVDAGSFMASTLAIQDQDFLQGRYDLKWDGQSPLRAIVNQGEIRVADGGFLALISPLLDNQGTLIAERGQVVLGATRQASLTVDARGLLQVVIPDGFGAAAGAPGAVLLTPGQMSDTLASLVQHYAPSEAGAIVDTDHGIQLTAGEGLLLNQGSIRADAAQGNAGSILLNSSQATVLAPGSLTSASAQVGNGGDIRVLSADYARQQGTVQASSLSGGNGGFVEVSAPHVAMSRGVNVSATQGTAGVFLLDPDNVFIRNGGADPPNQPFGVPGAGDIEVDPAALDIPNATVTLQANQNIIFDDFVQVNLSGNTDLVLQAKENIIMGEGSAIHASDPGASVTMDALLSIDVRTLEIATSHLKAGTFVRFNGGILGAGGSPSLVNVSAASVSFADGSVTEMNGSDVNFNSVTGGDFVVGTNARFDLLSSGSSNATISAAGVGLNPGSTMLVTGTGNRLNFESTSGVFNMGDGSTISAGGPGSVLNVTAAQSVDLREVLVPNINAHAGTFARFDGGQVGTHNQASNVNVTADRISFLSGTTTEMIGTDVNVTLSPTSDFLMETSSHWDLNGTNSQKAVVTAGTSIFLDDNARLTGAGPTDLLFDAGTFFAMDPGSSIVAEDAASTLSIITATSADIRTLRIPRSDVNALTFARFFDGTLGAPGSNTLVTVVSPDISVFAGSTLNVVGLNVELDLLATSSSVFFGQDSLIQLSGQTSNVLIARSDNDLLFIGENTRINSTGETQILLDSANDSILQRNGSAINIAGPGLVRMNAGVNVVTQATSSINITSGTNTTGANSQFEVHAGLDALLDGNANVGSANVTADRNLQMSGEWGRSGSPVRIDSTGGNVVLFNTHMKGSQVDWNLSATNDSLIEAAGSTVRIDGSNNHVHWSSAGTTQLGERSLLTASGSTQMLVQSTGRFLQFANSTLSLADPASNFDLTTGASPLFNRVEVGGRLAATASGGNNIRIADQLVANEVLLSSPGQLLDDRTDRVPAIVANSSLNVTVANISGPLTDSDLDLVKAMPFATGPNARVRFNLTGPNNTTLGNRSANLFYAYPQSGDVAIVHPQSDVALYNEPAPPPPASQGIQTREDFSPQAFQEVTYQSAQAQVQLSSLYSVADLPASDSVLLLQYDNAGLTDAYSVSYMTSALVERVVLSPEQVVRARAEREKRNTERPTNLLLTGNDEDEQTLYWRRLIEGILIWEE